MHYVYHPLKGAKLVTPEQYQRYLDNGWFDTPAKFPQNREVPSIVRLTPAELILPPGTVPRGTSEEDDLKESNGYIPDAPEDDRTLESVEKKVMAPEERVAKPRGRPKTKRTGT